MQEIDEIVHRLRQRDYALKDVREAAEIVAGLQSREQILTLSEKLRCDHSRQVRIMGLCLLNALANQYPPAQAALGKASAEESLHLEAIKRLDTGAEQVTTSYPGMVSLIKCWLKESKAS